MNALLTFATLAVTTVAATGAAALLSWLLLQAAFQLMQSAAASRSVVWGHKPQLVAGTKQLIRAYAVRQ
jgi:hypothetical protein